MTSTPLHCPQIEAFSLKDWTGRPPGHEPVLVMRQGWNAGSDLEGGTVRFGWNGRGLLLHATLPDRDIFNPVTEFNEPAYLKGDVFEIFLRPLSQEAYYELHISPSNQLFQVRFPKNLAEAQPGETIDPTFVKVDLESTVRIDRQNECWVIFAEIPLAAICEDGPVLPESRWLISFSRYDYTRTPDGMTAELFSTSPHQELSFHRQHEWTLITLGSPNGKPA
jgi:hypothetical protein